MTKAMEHSYHDLHLLEMAEHKLMLEEFLVKKSNLDIRDKSGKNSLYWAINNRSKHNCKLLLKYGIDLMVSNNLHAIFHAIESLDIDTFVYLLSSRNININMQNNTNETLLMRAVQVESVEMVRYLLNHGANVHFVNESKEAIIDHAKLCKNRNVFNLIHYRILDEKSRNK